MYEKTNIRATLNMSEDTSGEKQVEKVSFVEISPKGIVEPSIHYSKPMERIKEFNEKVDKEKEAKTNYVNDIDMKSVEFLTKKEAAEFVKCSERSIDRAREMGLPAYSLGREIVFIKEQLARWVVAFGKV